MICMTTSCRKVLPHKQREEGWENNKQDEEEPRSIYSSNVNVVEHSSNFLISSRWDS